MATQNALTSIAVRYTVFMFILLLESFHLFVKALYRARHESGTDVMSSEVLIPGQVRVFVSLYFSTFLLCNYSSKSLSEFQRVDTP
jgi:hypothetical protein